MRYFRSSIFILFTQVIVLCRHQKIIKDMEQELAFISSVSTIRCDVGEGKMKVIQLIIGARSSYQASL